jgi:dipeptidyl aminopeptidase/acylaminoacyl peptidase
MKLRRPLTLFLTALFLSPALAYAAKPAQTSPAHERIGTILKTVGKTQRFGSVAVSPDGSMLAWTLNGKVQLADADGSHVRKVAMPGDAKTKCSAGELGFSPDGRELAMLSNCGGRDPKQRNILLADVRAAHPKARQLSRLEGYVHGVTWAPDGRTLGILYVIGDNHAVGATSAVKPRTGVIGEHGVEHQRFATINARSGELRLITPPNVFVYEYAWAPDARKIAFVGAPPPGRNNWWVAKLYSQTLGSEPHVLLDPGTVKGSLHGLQIALPRFSPHGKRIALIGGLMSDQGVTGGDIYVLPASGGPAHNVTAGADYTPGWLSWTGKHTLLVSAFAGGDTRLLTLKLDQGKTAQAHTLATIPASTSDGSAMSSIALDARHDRFAFIHSTFTQPPEIFTGTLASSARGEPTAIKQAPHAVTQANAALTPIWGQARSITWHNEGLRIQGWLQMPAHYDPSKHYPMVVLVHGGPAYGVRPSWGNSFANALSAMGYFVLQPNPRGSFGQGEKFTQANRRDFGYGDLRDILAGVDAVEKQFPVDDKRLGLMGWSYGGFMSMFAPTQTHRFAAAVAGAGLSNWQSYYGQNSIDQWMIPFFGASVYDDPAVYAKSSAINFIKNNTTPTLVLVGQYDGETPAPQSFEFWHALKAMGVPTRLVVYPGEGHGFRNPKHRRDVLERSLAWFHTHLGSNAGH